MPLASDEGGNGFHAPSIADFFPAPVLWEGTIFEFNRIQLIRIVAAVAITLLFVLVARRARLVPGRVQGVVEMGLDFVRVQIGEQILGKERARQYVPLLTTMFFAILAFNLTSVVPGFNMAGTALMGLPLLLAVWAYVRYLWAGVSEHGVGGFLKMSLFPPGVPWFMYVLLTPIEFLTVFIIRPATLAIRLMANMVAGHLMLVLCFSATQYFLFDAEGLMKSFGALTFVAGLAMTLFEMFVGALQAYIFVVLTAVYISLSVEHEH
ncbi:F0F1 ATP synthase subunit A [Cellulomonas palmilytica]|uniref:F0F1 ATP synthase subunit A n=1 Tax=Cellulomonas palmilytica TaxID=2608402 RepID=UPI0037BFC5A1|nr:F0F1 ATP synthase subunit A [Cellulomonas palmilytica]